jgi:signal transduction histidine kinase/ligand-binding sensor domain-containing protein/DNA-binding response OmpR family regulator
MGLSSPMISCLLQDSKGFLWAGTYNGLNRFDGYAAKSFSNEPGETGSISGNIINCMFQDKSGIIWIGTDISGLNKYNPYSDNFTTYRHNPDDSLTISSDRITAIHEDQFENLWIGTGNGLNLFDRSEEKFNLLGPGYITTIFEDSTGRIWVGINHQGLYLVNRDKKTFIPFEDYFSLPNRLSQFSVYAGVIDQDGTFWMGTDQGLIRFNPHNRKFTHYTLDLHKNQADSCNFIQSILLDRTRTGSSLWIGTLNGLYKFDPKREIFRRFVHNPMNDFAISNNNIRALLMDKSGCLWVGSELGGIDKANTNRNYIRHYLPNPLNRGNPENNIEYLFRSKSGQIWIGTRGGFHIFDKYAETLTSYRNDPGKANSLSHNFIRCIFQDVNNNIWIGTGDGLNKFDGKTGFVSYHRDPHDQYSLSNNHITAINGTPDGKLIIGTYWGLNVFDPNTQKFVRYFNDPENPNSLSDNTIHTILTDNEGIIWVGTVIGGLNRFDPISGHFIHYKNDPANTQSISSNYINTIFDFPVNNRPTLWIGTYGGGLCQFDKKTGIFKTYTKKDGLRNNIVFFITADLRGNLWLGTQGGISILNLQTMKFTSFEMGVIIPTAAYACVTDQDGEMFWGGWFGLACFYPDSIKLNPCIPEIVLTDLKINNQPVRLDTAVSYKKTLKLTYQENFLSFEFAALDFNRPASNLYLYKMDGIDPDWVATDASRCYAAYTDLDPGEYVFHVKGSNNDGIWNEEGTSLKIIITPPWWKTNWAYSFYLLLMVLVIYGAWRFQMNRISMRHNLEMKQLHAEKLEEVDRMKSHFFANISHEFRTPLTLILGPISQMFSQTRSSNFRENLSMMKRNTLRLQRLINQLLNLSKLEAGRMKLQVREENIVPLLRSFVQAFESLAKLKNIQLVFQSEQENIPAYIDREKLETIINNLLSNAFKFTPEGGSVVVEISLPPFSLPPLDKGGKPVGVGICISDTGIGIPPDRLPHIFDRFYQVDDSYNREPAPLDSGRSKKYQLGEKYFPTGQEGTGIGLALTKELVEFHKGEISVSSEIGKGTTFVIHLPIRKEFYTSDEIVVIPTPLVPPLLRGEDKGGLELYSNDIKKFQESRTTIKKSLPILLIVEDNPDMRSYIRSNLENTYRIIEAEDGQEGFNKCAKVLPDLVISDVMMPTMGGFELCAKLKTDHRTSHIPVILLTARATAEDKIGGLETGADDYIIKPFDARELRVRVRNLIEQRRKLRERFRKEGILQPQEIAVTSTDQKFLQKVLDIVESHISDERFSVETFGKEIGMSRALLHRKMRALINHSPSEFIRSLRLNHAAQLLAKHGGNVTEIAFQVGFNNLSYFARCFHQQFGVSPSVYASQRHSK